MATHLYLVQLAIPAALEDEFNRLYDEGYVPALLQVPGVGACARYRLEWADTPDMPEYLTTYEITDPAVPKSAAWRQASIDCGWAERIRPHLTVRRHGMFRRLG